MTHVEVKEARYDLRVTCDHCKTTAAFTLESPPYNPSQAMEIKCLICGAIIHIPPLNRPS